MASKKSSQTPLLSWLSLYGTNHSLLPPKPSTALSQQFEKWCRMPCSRSGLSSSGSVNYDVFLRWLPCHKVIWKWSEENVHIKLHISFADINVLPLFKSNTHALSNSFDLNMQPSKTLFGIKLLIQMLMQVHINSLIHVIAILMKYSTITHSFVIFFMWVNGYLEHPSFFLV